LSDELRLDLHQTGNPVCQLYAESPGGRYLYFGNPAEYRSRGREVQLAFIGNKDFADIQDTIRYYTDPNATDAIEREQFVNELKKGLLQFLIQTPMIDQITYNVELEEGEGAANTVENDPWNNWVFNIGGNGWLDGEATYSSVDLTGRFNASKITDQHKFRFSTFYNFEKSTFKLTGGNESFFKKSYNLRLLYVKSLGPKWSVGFITRTGSTTFGNMDVFHHPQTSYRIQCLSVFGSEHPPF
jgi:hypothetical protein